MVDGGYLYVVAFSNGTVKIGQTSGLKGRLAAHAAAARVFGATIVDSWTSPFHLRPDISETALLVSASERAVEVMGREWFTGLGFKDAVEMARAIPVTAVRQTRPSTRDMLSTRSIMKGKSNYTARRLWLCLWQYAPWGDRRRPSDVWVGNARLSRMTQTDVRGVQLALKVLRSSGMITTRWGRPKGANSTVRVITLVPAGYSLSDIAEHMPVYRLPSAEALTEFRASLEVERPGSVMTVALAVLACASMEISNGRGLRPTEPVTIYTRIAQLREMSGAGPTGSGFYQRLAHLEASGLISRCHDGWRDGIVVHPLSSPTDSARSSAWRS